MGITGLTLGTAIIVDYECLWTVGVAGYANILIYDSQLANYATLQANINDEIIITDGTYGTNFFQGEVKLVEILSQSLVMLRAKSNVHKTTKTKCNYNPLLLQTFARYLPTGDKIADYVDAPFSGLGFQALVLEKTDLRELKLYPISQTWSGTAIDVQEINYHHQPDLYQESDESYTNYNDKWDFNFYIYVTDITEISSVKASIKIQFPAESGGYDTLPYMYFWLSTKFAYQDIPVGDTDGSNDEVLTYEFVDVDLVASGGAISSTYLTDEQPPNSSGFKRYTLTVGVRSGRRNTSANRYHYIDVDYCKITVETSTDQNAAVGQGYIVTVASNTAYFNNALGWAVDEFPLSEGFGAGDVLYVVRWLDVMMTGIFSAADTDLLYSSGITDDDIKVLFTYDLTYELLADVLNKVEKVLNAPWYIMNSTQTISQRTADNAAASAVTLTNADFIKFPFYSKDGSNLRSRVTTVGKITGISASITPEYAFEGGNEEEVHSIPETSNLDILGTDNVSLQSQHTNSKIYTVGTLNYSSPAQTYTALNPLDTIALTLTNGNGDTIISHTSPLLTITSMKLENGLKTGFQDYVTVKMELLE